MRPPQQGGKANAAVPAQPQQQAYEPQQQPMAATYDPNGYYQPSVEPKHGWYGGYQEPQWQPMAWDYGPSSWQESSYGYATYEHYPRRKKEKNSKAQS